MSNCPVSAPVDVFGSMVTVQSGNAGQLSSFSVKGYALNLQDGTAGSDKLKEK